MLELTETREEKVKDRTKRLRAVSAQLTMTEEREWQMLAQELHDNLGQLLAVIKIRLTSLTANALQPSISQIANLVDQADQSARMITSQLSPPILRTLVVSDSGCGFDAAHFGNDSARGNGFGLSSIHERILNIGGEMEIDSGPDNGTMITLAVPWHVQQGSSGA